jgi:hypothetical protein
MDGIGEHHSEECNGGGEPVQGTWYTCEISTHEPPHMLLMYINSKSNVNK